MPCYFLFSSCDRGPPRPRPASRPSGPKHAAHEECSGTPRWPFHSRWGCDRLPPPPSPRPPGTLSVSGVSPAGTVLARHPDSVRGQARSCPGPSPSLPPRGASAGGREGTGSAERVFTSLGRDIILDGCGFGWIHLFYLVRDLKRGKQPRLASVPASCRGGSPEKTRAFPRVSPPLGLARCPARRFPRPSGLPSPFAHERPWEPRVGGTPGSRLCPSFRKHLFLNTLLFSACLHGQ